MANNLKEILVYVYLGSIVNKTKQNKKKKKKKKKKKIHILEFKGMDCSW